jgi:hypothetical protein
MRYAGNKMILCGYARLSVSIILVRLRAVDTSMESIRQRKEKFELHCIGTVNNLEPRVQEKKQRDRVCGNSEVGYLDEHH